MKIIGADQKNDAQILFNYFINNGKDIQISNPMKMEVNHKRISNCKR